MNKTPYILLLFISIFIVTQINAQQTVVKKAIPILPQDTIYNSEEEPDSSVVIPDDFDNSLDYLLYTWANNKNVTFSCPEKTNPEVTEAQYKTRLKKLPHVIEMPFNNTVKSFIEIYTFNKRRQVEYMLGLSKYYFPIFEDALEASKLPLELKFLPVIESALTPKAVSRVGAGGLWQFMIPTGRMYDLEINSLVDERFDPEKSTKAASRYLKDLFSIYGDWNLAIAAYNCGPGNVNKAIRRAGGKRDFWDIYPFLPRETRGYVPIFVAANYVMTYHTEHNLCPAKVSISTMNDTIMVNRRVHFEQISSVLHISIDELRMLNPQYKRDIVPGDIKSYSICMPINYVNQFIDKQNEIFAYKADVFSTRREEAVPQIASHQVLKQDRNSQSRRNKDSDQYSYHTVRRGQTLGGIARKYHVTVAQLKQWNGLGRKSSIRYGQKLKLKK